MMCLLGLLPMVNILLALISFHQWGWAPALSISSRIYWLGWFTRSGIPLSCDWDWDQAVEGSAGTFGWAPPMWVRQHWGSSLGGSHGGSMDKGVEGLGASSHSSAIPPTRKVVSSVGRVGSLPKSSLMWNVTCFFLQPSGAHSSMHSCGGGGCPLVCMGASPLLDLLWDAHGCGCRWRSLGRCWATCQQDVIVGDWEKETGTCLVVEARDYSVLVNDSDSWSGNITSLILIAQLKGLL